MTHYATLLLVEDDVSLAGWIQEFLEQKGYKTIHVSRGDAVMDSLKNNPVDLVLLDVMLPGMNGMDVCKAIRRDYTMPILMLTAQGEEMDEILGLEAGANDYIIKPVRPRVLLARVQAALRNSQSENPQSDQQLQFGQLVIYRDSYRVTLADDTVPLSTAEFDLLWYLAGRAGQICSRDDVFIALKGRPHDGMDRRFDVMVSTLRKKLNDDSANPSRIKTVWGKGYLFVADAWNQV